VLKACKINVLQAFFIRSTHQTHHYLPKRW
jgi:hypothetical protein